ncbi:MAG: thioredoxin domain-containing protein, partial [Thermoanaerobaculia bacterium]
GYSTCYWCHVMERESFSDPEVAEVMNREFINIKMDREERPDLDDIYMVATQVLSGHGGWPNSVFLTPDLEPFFAGTYFPPQDRHGQPAFRRVLLSLAEAWKERRGDIEEQGRGVATSMKRYLDRRTAPAPVPPHPSLVRRSVAALERLFDPSNGGFGGAPKFPTPSSLFLLLETAGEDGREAEMLSATLEAMARGGIFDQLGGGFHRYATDTEWRIPHFEKMLYDNGLLLELYAREWGRTGDSEMARVARETAAFLERELLDDAGFFWSALDAETDGEEGAYYVWTRDELEGALGEEDFRFAAPLLGFDGPPFFEGASYVLHLPKPLADQAAMRRIPLEELRDALGPIRHRLLDERGERERIATDDKVLADWNGMAIAGLATAGAALGEKALVEQATRAADFVLRTMRPPGGPLVHSWREGRAGPSAFLSDYAFLVRGLLALHQATGRKRWLAAAAELAAEQIERLADPAGGFFVAEDRADLLYRSKEVFDGAIPGANSVAALNLLELAERTGEAGWAAAAEGCLRTFSALLENHPAAVRTMALVAGRRARLRRERPELFEEASTPASEAPDAKVRGSLAVEAPGEDGWRAFTLELEIDPGWHIYPPEVEGGLGGPTTVEGDEVELRGVVFPRGVERQPVSGEPSLRVYEGRVAIRGELHRVADEGRLLVGFQLSGAGAAGARPRRLAGAWPPPAQGLQRMARCGHP